MALAGWQPNLDTCITYVELQIPIDGYKPKFGWTGQVLIPEPITS